MSSKRFDPDDAAPDSLVPIGQLKPYGVGRTTAFEKMKVDGDKYDPSFPISLIIQGRHHFLRSEMLQWALQHRNTRSGNLK